MGFTSYEVDNDKRFRDAINRAKKEVQDLTIPLTLISKDFFRSNKAIWALKGPGQYPDLSDVYKQRKKEKFKFVYPILKANGALERSLTNPTDSNSINEIINKAMLIVGTKVKYGIYHQSDEPRTKIPLRKFLFIGPESSFAPSSLSGRAERWLNTINSFVLAKLGNVGSTSTGMKPGIEP